MIRKNPTVHFVLYMIITTASVLAEYAVICVALNCSN